MKISFKVILIISVLLMSCTKEQELIFPPIISFSSHESGETVTEIDTISINSSDNDNTNRVDFIIDGLLLCSDMEPPFECIWNTLSYQDLFEYWVIAMLYDNDSTMVSSDTILLNVDNRVNLWGNFFSRDTMEVILPARSLTGSIPKVIVHLKELRVLDLSSNLISGKFPNELWTLTNLNILDLHDNNFSDSIPNEIENLSNLSELYLHDNYLIGSIPQELGTLIFLNELRLKNNYLEGIVPETICSLDNLIFFNALGETNFSNNKLCPPYPDCIEEYLGDQDTQYCD